MVAKYGFTNAKLKDIVTSAAIDDAVFYKRFGGLNAILSTIALKDYKHWMTSVLVNSSKYGANDEISHTKRIFTEIINNLYDNKGLASLIVWEVIENNAAITETMTAREAMYSSLFQNFAINIKEEHPDINLAFALILGGIFYISMIKDKSLFWGVDFSTKNGQNLLIDIVDELLSRSASSSFHLACSRALTRLATTLS